VREVNCDVVHVFWILVDLVMEKKTPLERFHLKGYIGTPYSYLESHPAFVP
jgi:hypothetical protein